MFRYSDIYYGDISPYGIVKNNKGREIKLLFRSANLLSVTNYSDYNMDRRLFLASIVIDMVLHNNSLLFAVTKSREDEKSDHENIIRWFLKGVNVDITKKEDVLHVDLSKYGYDYEYIKDFYIINDPEFVTYCILRYNLREYE